MVLFTILAGGYDVFIAAYLFNAVTSTLTLQDKFSSGNSPSWITTDVSRGVLYAVNEIAEGAVQSFLINPNGALSGPIDTVDSGGNGPAFCVQFSNGVVAAMNYGSGNGSFIPTTIDGETFVLPASNVNFPPPLNGVSHPHMALEYYDEVFVPDLGSDVIWRLKEREDGNGYQIQGSILQPKGSGPRHIAVYNDRLFTLHELSSMLSVQNIPDSPNGTAITYASVSIIPANPTPGAVYAAAEILIPSPCLKFPKPYIYASNRNTGVETEEGDSIAIFEHVNQGQQNESLVLINQVFTGLNQIRGMQIGNEDINGGEQYLIAGAASGTGGVALFRRTEEGRNLELVARNKDIPTRTSFVWL